MVKISRLFRLVLITVIVISLVSCVLFVASCVPKSQSRSEKASEQPKIIERGMHLCRIDEIQLQRYCPERKIYSGTISYFTEDEVYTTTEFINIRPSFLEINDPIMGDNWTRHIPFEKIRKVKFEAIPYAKMKSWPERFPFSDIPKIKVKIKYRKSSSRRSDKSVTYSTYATGWIYFYEKRLSDSKDKQG